MPTSFRRMARKAGLPPGSLIYTGEKEHLPTKITVTRYNEQDFREDKLDSLTACPLADDQAGVTWINVSGIHQVKNLEKLGECFTIHPLVLEDILDAEQRPKIEDYDDYLYIVLATSRPGAESQELVSEQISLILGPHYVISFQEGTAICLRPSGSGSSRPKGGSASWGPIISPIPSSI